MTFDDVRPEVKAFALLMEQKLRENDGKGGWNTCGTTYLSRRCGNELKELRASVSDLNRVRANWPRDEKCIAELAAIVGREAADVGNFAMMIADVCGGLGKESFAVDVVAGAPTMTRELPDGRLLVRCDSEPTAPPAPDAVAGVPERQAEAWNWCPVCRQLVDADDVCDGSEVTCLGCRRVYTCVAFTDGSWQLIEQGE